MRKLAAVPAPEAATLHVPAIVTTPPNWSESPQAADCQRPRGPRRRSWQVQHPRISQSARRANRCLYLTNLIIAHVAPY
jgi:hypothetical protein